MNTLNLNDMHCKELLFHNEFENVYYNTDVGITKDFSRRYIVFHDKDDSNVIFINDKATEILEKRI